MNANQVMTILSQSKVFGDLEPELLDTLVFLGYPRHFAAGEAVYRKGEESNNRFGLILSGSVNLIKKDGQVFKPVGVGEIVGEIALSDPNHKRTITVAAAEPAEILEWDAAHVKEQIPVVWKRLVKLAWEHLSEYYEGLE